MPYEWAIKAGKSERIARELEHDVWFSKESLKKLKPVPGSFKFLNWFIDREIEIPIITSRMPDLDTRRVTKEWINHWFPAYLIEHLKIRDPKSPLKGSEFKAIEINEQNRGIHFEDDVGQLDKIFEHNPRLFVVLLSNLSTSDEKYAQRMIRIPDGFYGPNLFEVNNCLLHAHDPYVSHNIDSYPTL